jgi:hypothetical protein
MVKVPVVEPLAIETLVGTTAFALFDVKLTTMPAVEAGTLIVTVPIEDDPPRTEVGETVKPVRTGGLTVSPAVTELEPDVAVITAFTIV